MVTELKIVGRSALPKDLPAKLRELADWVEKGTITEMVVGYVEAGEYCFVWPSSLHDSLVLTSLLQQTAIDRLRR